MAKKQIEIKQALGNEELGFERGYNKAQAEEIEFLEKLLVIGNDSRCGTLILKRLQKLKEKTK